MKKSLIIILVLAAGLIGFIGWKISAYYYESFSTYRIYTVHDTGLPFDTEKKQSSVMDTVAGK